MTAVKELLKKLNKEDPLRKFVISSSQKKTGSATFACSGNGHKLQSVYKSQLQHVSEDSDEDDIAYALEGVRPVHSLDMFQIQQISHLGREHTSPWHWAKFGRITSSTVHLAKVSSHNLLQKTWCCEYS